MTGLSPSMRSLHESFSLISRPSWTGTSSLRTVRWDVNYTPTCKGPLQRSTRFKDHQCRCGT